MSANELDYKKLYGMIDASLNDVTMAKCNCTACNSCTCGRCKVSQCTGCRGRSKYTSNELKEIELEWDEVVQ